jgi:hypothetical protein
MDPGTWGPYAWKTLHAIAAHCDTANERDIFVKYVESLKDALPCKTCRAHMTEYLKDHPIPVDSFFRYTVDFHNAVNRRLNKDILSEDEARKNFAVSCNQGCEAQSLDTKGAAVFYGVMILSLFALVLFAKKYIA